MSRILYFRGHVSVKLEREMIVTTLKFCHGEVQPTEIETLVSRESSLREKENTVT